MTHECACPDRQHTLESVRADQTVADVVQRHPGALEVMKRLGINHCCGAQLSLAEAAASAGVPLETLLTALDERRTAPA